MLYPKVWNPQNGIPGVYDTLLHRTEKAQCNCQRGLAPTPPTPFTACGYGLQPVIEPLLTADLSNGDPIAEKEAW